MVISYIMLAWFITVFVGIHLMLRDLDKDKEK